MPEIFLNGPAGRIEGRYTQSINKKAPLALILHPHPLHGGTMNNSMVYNACKILVEHGFTVLRINFRGVGRSQGEFDNGIGEMTDAATALDWLQLNNPHSTTHMIAGFSFGAWVAMQLIMRRPEINNFIAVSLPVNKYDFSFLSPCPIPGLMLHGDSDSIVPEELVFELAYKLSKQKRIKIDYKVIKGADHFFRGKIDQLVELMSGYLYANFSRNQFTPDLVHDYDSPEITRKEKSRQKVFLD